MTTLDDKLLGEKLQYYCSSSSESDDEEKELQVEEKKESYKSIGEWNGFSKNTGPKGVIEDWQNYKKLERDQRRKDEKEQLENCEKMYLTCTPNLKNESEDNIDSEKFLLEYRKKRMQEMLLCYGNKNLCFGSVIDIKSTSKFLQVIDEEDKNAIIIIHIYDSNNFACKKINNILTILAEQYKDVKFCKVLTTTAGLSLNFKISGVPAFLVYKNKQIIGNFIRLTDEFGDDFCESDIENFLMDRDILGNNILLPKTAETV